MTASVPSRPLGDIARIGAGNSAPQGDHLFEGGEFPFFRTSDVGRIRFGEISEAADNVNEFGARGLRLFPKGTILFPKSGASTFLNHRVMMGVEGYVSSHLATIVADESKVLPRFLLYFLSTIATQNLVQDHAYPSLNLPVIAGIGVPLPPMREQQRIVAILDEAFAGIATAKAHAETNLQNAREAFDAYLHSVFTRRGIGWVTKSLGEIADIKGGKRVPKGCKLEVEPTGFPYLRVTDFLDTGTIDTADLRYISAEVHRVIKNYVVQRQDLYVSIAGTIGKTGIVPDELDGANLTENACRLVFREGVNNRYVYYFTTTRDFMAQVGVNTRTAAQPKLALSRLATIRLSLPPIELQIKLAADFDRLREESQRLESSYTRKLVALDELKQSLLHQAFSAQL